MEDDSVVLQSDVTFPALAKCILITIYAKIRGERPLEHKENDKRVGRGWQKWQHMFVFLAMTYGRAPCIPYVLAGQGFWDSGQ